MSARTRLSVGRLGLPSGAERAGVRAGVVWVRWEAGQQSGDGGAHLGVELQLEAERPAHVQVHERRAARLKHLVPVRRRVREGVDGRGKLADDGERVVEVDPADTRRPSSAVVEDEARTKRTSLTGSARQTGGDLRGEGGGNAGQSEASDGSGRGNAQGAGRTGVRLRVDDGDVPDDVAGLEERPDARLLELCPARGRGEGVSWRARQRAKALSLGTDPPRSARRSRRSAMRPRGSARSSAPEARGSGGRLAQRGRGRGQKWRFGGEARDVRGLLNVGRARPRPGSTRRTAARCAISADAWTLSRACGGGSACASASRRAEQGRPDGLTTTRA